MTQSTTSRDNLAVGQPSTNREPFTPWYREPWAWYIVGILMVTFAWGSFQVYTAFTHQDSVVIDDYYKNGKTINQDMTRIENARILAVEGILTIDELIGEVRVKMQGNPAVWPGQLKLSFLSPVFKDKDKAIMLTRSFGISAKLAAGANAASGAAQPGQNPIYVGQLEALVAGRYYLQLETLDELIPEVGYETGWKITLEAVVSPGTPITLKNPDA
ncbi:FixH family protein [Endozoicomonas sp. YOMI1]|uniref:FixH family protein n=1 Tax=Endozoicomonas sp. YOMI1 TaxID=2828739 RepID=UPI0021475907|nr:FixH family protein [Endozoicomonas sp. YOMI1]